MKININQLRKVKMLVLKINETTDLVLSTSSDEQTLNIDIASNNNQNDDYKSFKNNDVNTCSKNTTKLDNASFNLLNNLRGKTLQEIIKILHDECGDIYNSKMAKQIGLIKSDVESIPISDQKLTIMPKTNLEKMANKVTENIVSLHNNETKENITKNPYKIKKIKQ